MLIITRLLMFVACLMYGMMPGMAADISMPMMGSRLSDVPSNHSAHDVAQALNEAKNQSDPCPHKGSLTHAPFCAACLVLLPDLTFAEKGTSPPAKPFPEVQAAFIGSKPSPPLPPPRV